jgi:hypothetical protein
VGALPARALALIALMPQARVATFFGLVTISDGAPKIIATATSNGNVALKVPNVYN